MIWLQLLLLAGFSLVLIKATDIVSDSLQQLSKLTKVGKFALTSLLLAFATSVPELVVSVTAALEGRPNLALGVVLGSNIANVSLVVGMAAIVGGSFAVTGEFLKTDVFSVFLAGVMPLMLLLDNKLSRTDGLILLFIYGMYNFSLLRGKNKSGDWHDEGEGSKKIRSMLVGGVNKKRNRWLAWLFLGAAMLMFAGDMIVKTGVALASALKVPVFLVGLFMVAVGTTMPELAFEIRAIRKKQAGMVLGNLFGSLVVNSTLVLGITALISPIILTNGLDEYLLAAAGFGVIFLLFWRLVKTKKKLERWEGAVLLLVYALLIWLEWNK